jgi:hypothetical protein
VRRELIDAFGIVFDLANQFSLIALCVPGRTSNASRLYSCYRRASHFGSVFDKAFARTCCKDELRFDRWLNEATIRFSASLTIKGRQVGRGAQTNQLAARRLSQLLNGCSFDGGVIAAEAARRAVAPRGFGWNRSGAIWRITGGLR